MLLLSAAVDFRDVTNFSAQREHSKINLKFKFNENVLLKYNGILVWGHQEPYQTHYALLL